jgi:hypothetical protein
LAALVFNSGGSMIVVRSIFIPPIDLNMHNGAAT